LSSNTNENAAVGSQIAEAYSIDIINEAGHWAFFVSKYQRAALPYCLWQHCIDGNITDEFCKHLYDLGLHRLDNGLLRVTESANDVTTSLGVVHQFPHPPPSSHPFDVPHYCFMPI
jgi:hypothetical protein